MRLEQSPSAERDLADIAEYTLARHGPAQAIAYIDGIEAAYRRLLAYPQIGQAQDELKQGLRGFPSGEHRIFYLVRPDSLLIVRVLHKAMDAGRWV